MQLSFESARLSFRPLEAGDLDLIIAQWTDPEVTRFIADKPSTVAELEARMPIVTRRCAGGAIGIWCLTQRETGEKLGTAVLLPIPVEADDTEWDRVTGDKIPEGDIEIGYILKRSAWWQGYATEACRRLLQFAFEETDLQKVAATIDPENAASRHVLEKCGLVDEGPRRAYGETIPGFCITRVAWLAGRAGTA